MNKIERIKEKIKETEKRKKEQLLELKELIRRKIIKCPRCGKGTRLSSWTFIKKEYYVYIDDKGNGYWKSRQAILCDIQCPKCGKKIIILGHPEKDKIISYLSPPLRKEELFENIARTV